MEVILVWNEITVEKLLREAAQTINGLRVGGITPSPLRAWWPDIIRKHEEAYGYHKPKVLPAIPSPAAIDRLGQVERWVNKWLDENERHVVWSRVGGRSWRRVAADCKRWNMAISHEQARIVYRRAIWTLVRGLNGQIKEVETVL